MTINSDVYTTNQKYGFNLSERGCESFKVVKFITLSWKRDK